MAELVVAAQATGHEDRLSRSRSVPHGKPWGHPHPSVLPLLLHLRNSPVADFYGSAAAVGYAGIVRDHDNRPAGRVEFVQHLQNELAGLAVEVAGRLVREQDRRIVDQRAPDGDALLLTAGEFVRTMMAPVGSPTRSAISRRRRRRSCGRHTLVEKGVSRFSRRRLRADEIEALKGRIPMRRPRTSDNSSSSSFETSRPSSQYVPALGRSRQPRMFISVVLPLPDGPMMAR